jgi:hypothetical protein
VVAVPGRTRLAVAAGTLVGRLITAPGDAPGAAIDAPSWLAEDVDPVARIAAASLVVLAGPDHARYGEARAILDAATEGEAGAFAAFYRRGLARSAAELERVERDRPAVAERFVTAAARLGAATTDEDARDAIWQGWYPQAVDILGREAERIADLRRARTVTVVRPAEDPLADPAREVLFTSNVLLTVPAAGTEIDGLPYPAELREAIAAAADEPQRYWFDHPIQLGVEPAANELLYGLHALDAAMGAESGLDPETRITCLLSVSVTHDGLGPVAGPYVAAELERSGGLRHLDVLAVTEGDTRRLVAEVLVPALAIARGDEAAQAERVGMEAVVGVDGEYGRHYSFLKAIAALWHVAIDRGVRATFKIDLDQVFPQDVLLRETGRTALEHLTTPTWGAGAVDAEGRPIELGMLAGALVNERDIERGLFTPDVALPGRPPRADERLFWSALPQAVSTQAEMMERHDGPIDGQRLALERIHVTGGTNGIRVDALRRHRPFTPTFIGRAEDQAYILSDLGRPGPRLAYVHAAGLIMRHDKEAFAGDAIAAAHVGKLIGDDVRILVFSAYADAAASDAAASDRRTPAGPDGGLDRAAIGRLLDPFTGGFVSDVPVSLVLARLAMRTLRMLADGEIDDGRRYALDGARRLAEVLDATAEPDRVAERLAGERRAWDAVYDALDALEIGLAAGDERARALQARATAIIDACRISVTRPAPD